MTLSESWIYQGRQEHGWFGHGTAPQDLSGQSPGITNPLFSPAQAADRVDYAAHCLIVHVPRNDRGRWTSAVSDSALTNLKTAVAAWYAARNLGRAAFEARFLDPGVSDEVTDRLRQAARGMIDARSYDDLAKAGTDLAVAAQKVGVDRWPRFLAVAREQAVHQAAKGAIPGVVQVNAPDEALEGAAILGLLLLFIVTPRPAPVRPTDRRPEEPQPPTVMEAKELPPVKEGETPVEVLKPDGQLVGQPGTSKDIRELPGGEQGAEELFDRLTKGGQDITPPGLLGIRKRMENGDTFVYRPRSTSGPPTIDVDVNGVGIRKLKFP